MNEISIPSSSVDISDVDVESCLLPLFEPRTIARGTDTHAKVVRVTLRGGGKIGHGEACAMERYGESQDSVISQVKTAAPRLAGRLKRHDLYDIFPAGAARNAVDCAWWDLEAKQTGMVAEMRAGLDGTLPVLSAFTITIKPPREMAEDAAREKERPLIKVKLGHFEDDRARIEAVRRAAPDARLIVDANEGWSIEELEAIAPVLVAAGVELVEQPLHADRDEVLKGRKFGIPLCADESCHTVDSLERLVGCYDYINIKLDKTGGLTEALALAAAARERALGLMVGCTNGSTLAMAPGFILGQLCDFCDLDAALFLRDREQGEAAYDGSLLGWSATRRWGLA